MATQKAVKKTASTQTPEFMQKVQKLRELYADASEISKTALENVIRACSGGPGTDSERRRRVPAGSVRARARFRS